ncbi:hypothetical protein GH733_017377, partial [Mirounga leonina]
EQDVIIRERQPHKGVGCEEVFDQGACSHEQRRKKFEMNAIQKSHFLGHQRTPTGERLYPCNDNDHGKSFSKDYILIVRRRIHTERILINAIIVGKPSVPALGFIKHKRTHTGEKTHECNQCGKSFNHHSSLFCITESILEKKHIDVDLIWYQRIHTSEKPYGCNQCQKLQEYHWSHSAPEDSY